MVFRSLIRVSGLLVWLLLSGSPAPAAQTGSGAGCESAETCFRRAVDFSNSNPDHALLQVERFRRVQAAHPGTLWARRAGLRAGWILAEHDPAQALDDLRAARKDFPLLEDHVLLTLGRALGRLESYHESALMFEAALALPAPSVLKHDTSYEAGFAWFEHGQCRRAIPHLRRATSGDPDASSAPRAFSVFADCAARLEHATQAKQALREIWLRYPESPEAREVNRIVQSGRPEALHWTPSRDDYYQRAETWSGLARFEAAIQDLQRFLDGQPRGPRAEQGLFRLAMAHVRLKQYPKAEKIFRRLVATPSAYTGKAAVWLAKVYLRQDQGQRLLTFRDAVPSGLGVNERGRIQWLSGVWAEGENMIPQAVAAYERAYRVADHLQIKVDALWRLGWLYYQQGAWKDAMTSFRTLATVASDRRWQNRARYWNARALDHLDRGDEAQALYRDVAGEWPMTYYGQLSQARLRSPIKGEPDQYRKQGERDDETMGGPASSGLQDNVHFQKAQELSALGLPREAAAELVAVREQYRNQPESLFAVARLMMDVGDDESALSIAKRYFQERLERRRVPPDSPLWRMAYPTGYLATIRQYAGSHVDPFLVAGIIREESLYDPGALSPVGAMGLMQLMPKTANRMARRLGLGSVTREELLEGELNVRLGVHYVGELLRDYQGNPVHVVAAYNAGPHAVKRWIEKFGDRDQDEFVELISYTETRRYVKRVISSYRIYHSLHSTTSSAFCLDSAC